MKSDDIARLLPEVFQQAYTAQGREHDSAGSGRRAPFEVLLDLMQQMQDPVEGTLDHLEARFDASRASDDFLPFLAQWVDLHRLLSNHRGSSAMPQATLASGHGRLRELVASAAELSRHRGTALGLRMFLERATGCEGFAIEEGTPDADRPFHFTVRAPSEAQQFEQLVRTVIAMEKPAHATCELKFTLAKQGESNE